MNIDPDLELSCAERKICCCCVDVSEWGGLQYLAQALGGAGWPSARWVDGGQCTIVKVHFPDWRVSPL